MTEAEIDKFLNDELTQKALSLIAFYQQSIQDKWLLGAYSTKEANHHAKGMAQMCFNFVNNFKETFWEVSDE